MFQTASVKIGLNEPDQRIFNMLKLMRGFGTTKVFLLHVSDDGNLDSARSKLEELADRVHSLGFAVETFVDKGSASRAIVSIANKLSVNYLALCWMPKALLLEALLGSIDADILRLSDTPIFVYNHRSMRDDPTLRRALYATDFKATDAAVMPYLRRSEFSAEELYLLHVGERAPDPTTEHARRQCVESNLDRLAGECRDFYSEVHTLQVVGERKSQILKRAEKHDVDLIIVGKCDSPKPFGNILGSTAEALPGRSKRSVFIVPAPQQSRS